MGEEAIGEPVRDKRVGGERERGEGGDGETRGGGSGGKEGVDLYGKECTHFHYPGIFPPDSGPGAGVNEGCLAWKAALTASSRSGKVEVHIMKAERFSGKLQHLMLPRESVWLPE